VRDVLFDADRSQVCCGNILPVKAALGKTALGLLRWAGHTNMAAAWRRLVGQPAQALAFIGMVWENSMILLTAAIRRSSLLLCMGREEVLRTGARIESKFVEIGRRR